MHIGVRASSTDAGVPADGAEPVGSLTYDVQRTIQKELVPGDRSESTKKQYINEDILKDKILPKRF